MQALNGNKQTQFRLSYSQRGNPKQCHLANPAAMEQYNCLKDTDDETDAFFLAEMSRLGILPEGYIYPRAGKCLYPIALRSNPARLTFAR